MPSCKVVIAGIDVTAEWEYGAFTPFAQTSGDLPDDKELNSLLKMANAVLGTLHGVSDCHTAAKRFVQFTGKGKAIRGWYVPSQLWEHSWIDFGKFVLDVYPVGGARPIILAKVVAKSLYITELPARRRLLDMDGDVSQG